MSRSESAPKKNSRHLNLAWRSPCLRLGPTRFWHTKDPGQQPFTYNAGVGSVITGWDQGLLGAAVGEVRKLDIPAEEGYGKGGFPAWGIPPNGGLFFEIEVLSIKGKSAEL